MTVKKGMLLLVVVLAVASATDLFNTGTGNASLLHKKHKGVFSTVVYSNKTKHPLSPVSPKESRAVLESCEMILMHGLPVEQHGSGCIGSYTLVNKADLVFQQNEGDCVLKYFEGELHKGWAAGLPWQNPVIVSESHDSADKSIAGLYSAKWQTYQHYQWNAQHSVHVFCLDKAIADNADEYRPSIKVWGPPVEHINTSATDVFSDDGATCHPPTKMIPGIKEDGHPWWTEKILGDIVRTDTPGTYHLKYECVEATGDGLPSKQATRIVIVGGEEQKPCEHLVLTNTKNNTKKYFERLSKTAKETADTSSWKMLANMAERHSDQTPAYIEIAGLPKAKSRARRLLDWLLHHGRRLRGATANVAGSISKVTGVKAHGIDHPDYLYYSSLGLEWRVGRFLDSKLYTMSVASVNELPQAVDPTTPWHVLNKDTGKFSAQHWQISGCV